jgi:hypothetical protein
VYARRVLPFLLFIANTVKCSDPQQKLTTMMMMMMMMMMMNLWHHSKTRNILQYTDEV